MYEAARMKQLMTLSSENCVFLSVANMNRKINMNDPIASDRYAYHVPYPHTGMLRFPSASAAIDLIVGLG